jgi:polysaccharide export outer membrane protein
MKSRYIFSRGYQSFIVILLMCFGISCTNTKNIVYFNDIKDIQLKSEITFTEPKIQVNDILSIIVSSLDKEASAVFNAPNESSYITNSGLFGSNRLTIGYLVNEFGNITFPLLGEMKVTGMTKLELTKSITRQLIDKKLLVEPIVTIRHLNYRVSVLGEVAKPGVFSVPNERLNLLEALSFAGDITYYGKKDNILLIRENDKGEKTIKRLDLTDQKILTSEYFYLQSNDILYVEPAANRLTREKTTQTLPIIFSILSVIVLGITNIN